MTPLEHRLRQRIDTLLDERQQLRDQIADLRARTRKRRNVVYELRRSRDMWRRRATR